MAEKKNRRKKAQRQNWKPHWTLRILKRLWLIAFGAFKIALGAAATVAIIVAVCAVVLVGAVGDYLEDEILTQVETKEKDYGQNLNSYMYYLDENGDIQKLQNIFAENNREWADYEDIPEHLIHATIAIEDKRFFEHQGVDWITTTKACFFMFFGNGDRGGSTITQQLVKNVTDNWSVTVQRKVQEIFTAIEYERRYSKEEIMEWYLNEIYMGNRTNGVRMAASIYFGKELESLTLAECASLISITNNPSLYNPYRDTLDAGGMTGMERNRERQLDTLDEMLNQGWITQAEYDEAVAQELIFKRGIAPEDRMTKCPNESCGYRGIASTFFHTQDENVRLCPECSSEVMPGEDASQEIYSYYVDTALEEVAQAFAERDGVEWNDTSKRFYKQKIASSGYHIYTCLDMRVQDAVDAIYEDLSQIPKVRSGQQPQSAIVVIDNTTGDIVAMSGGVGTDKVHDGQNRAVDSKLQTGSSIKPIAVYGPAFETGAISPATVISDMPQRYNGSQPWPKNDNRKYSYSRTVYSGISASVNAVAVNTLEIIGTNFSYNFLKEKLGIYSLIDSYTAASGQVMSDDDFAPLALGAQTKGLTVKEMANAFSTFPNGGVYREGRTFIRVYDHLGNLVLENEQETHQTFSEKTVNYIHYCLLGSVNYTGVDAKISGQYVYGKTGTTASNKDRWFCGYTKYYTAAVWFGFDTPEVINLVNGGNPAAFLFSKVLSQVHKGLPRVELINYNPLRSTSVCLDSGKQPTEACQLDVRGIDGIKRIQTALVYPEDVVKGSCDRHVLVEYCSGGGVCSEYCKLFAALESLPEGAPEDGSWLAKIEKKALVRLTEAEFAELVKAKNHGLHPEFLRDDYIYLTDNAGRDAHFKGFKGNLNPDEKRPYMICPKHTKEAWEAYQKLLELGADPTDPTDPTVPPVPGDDGGVG